MCFLKTINPQKRPAHMHFFQATKPIIAYKLVIVRDGLYISSAQDFPYVKGELYTLDIPLQNVSEVVHLIAICEGFHAYTSAIKGKVRYWSTVSLVKFIIPKGAFYIKDGDGHIVSDQIICTGEIIYPEQQKTKSHGKNKSSKTQSLRRP
jgi:hypothetical protein